VSRVFYSWQLSTPPKGNRYLIREALDAAAGQLARPAEVDEATRGVAGSPSIFETILSKIDRSAVFVADLTLLRIAADAEAYTCNPNVLLEYGYALARLGEGRIIPIINKAFGPIDKLPFDLRHKALRVTYSITPESTNQEIKVAQAGLTGLLRSELRLVLEDPRSVLSLTDGEVAIARLLLEKSPDGRQRDYTSQEDIASVVGGELSEVYRAIADLASRGYLERLGVVGTDSPPVRPSRSLFWDLDPYIEGWDPRADARTLAEELVSSSGTGHGELGTREFSERKGWSLRRLNPALYFLIQSEIVREDKTVVPDVVTLEIYETDATRKFLHGSYDPDQRRRG
jgi:hypothetical protein